MPKVIKLVSHPLVAQDILALVDEKLQFLALSKIKKLRDGVLHGTPLEKRKFTGDLSDCFKILFDTRRDIPPRFRIVYRNLHRGVEVVAVEVLSVGERYELEAYTQAAKRLNRIKKVEDK